MVKSAPALRQRRGAAWVARYIISQFFVRRAQSSARCATNVRMISLNIRTVNQGSLFTLGFLTATVRSCPEWQALSNGEIQAFERRLKTLFQWFPTTQKPNESQTKNDLIRPIPGELG